MERIGRRRMTCSYFFRNRKKKFNEIVKREERAIGTTAEARYGENGSRTDAVVIDRGPAARGELSIGQTAEAMTELQKRLCPSCQIVVAGLLAKVAKSDPSGSVPVHKADMFGGNLGAQRTPEAIGQPVNVNNFLASALTHPSRRRKLRSASGKRIG